MSTWDPSNKGALITLSGGDLIATMASGSWQPAYGVLSRSSGKYYTEVEFTSGSYCAPGFAIGGMTLTTYHGSNTHGWEYHANGNLYHNAAPTATGVTFAVGDIIGAAIDLGAYKMWFSKNNSWILSGDPASGANPAYTFAAATFFPAVSIYGAVATGRFALADMTYSPPTGFNAWDDDYETPSTINGFYMRPKIGGEKSRVFVRRMNL